MRVFVVVTTVRGGCGYFGSIVKEKDITDMMILNFMVADFVGTVIHFGSIIHYIMEMLILVGIVTQIIDMVATHLDHMIVVIWICTIHARW